MSVWNQYGQWTFTKLRFKSQLSTSWLIWHRNLKCQKSTITRVLWPTAFLSSFCSRTWGTRWGDLYLLNVSHQRFLNVGILPLTLASWPTHSPSHSRSTSRHRLQVCFQWQNSDFISLQPTFVSTCEPPLLPPFKLARFKAALDFILVLVRSLLNSEKNYSGTIVPWLP